MRIALGLLLATGCNTVFGLDPVTRADGGASDGPAADGVGPDTPTDDRDGDGVRDADDDCPDRPDPRQHDEDGDTVGDACDRCPHVPDLDQADQDGDGVGDICDPRPTQPGEWLARFDAFDDGVLADDWTQSGTGAGWFEDSDTLFTPDPLGLYVVTTPGPAAATWFRIETAVEVKGVDVTAVHSIAVSSAYQSESDAYLCNWRTDTGAMSSAGLIQQLTSVTVSTLANGAAAAVVDGAAATYTADTTVAGGQRCRIASGPVTDVAAITDARAATIALRANHALAGFRYLVVIAR